MRIVLITLALWPLVSECNPVNTTASNSTYATDTTNTTMEHLKGIEDFDLEDWRSFLIRTGILPLDDVEETRMKARWALAKARIDAINADPDATEHEKLFDFVVLSEKEFEETKAGLIYTEFEDLEFEAPTRAAGLIEATEEMRNDPVNRAILNEIFDGLDLRSIPDRYNPIGTNLITSVKQQGSCGSCAAFAAMAQIEQCFLKKNSALTPQNLNLAEQQVLDCAYDGNEAAGCQGATLDVYQSYYRNNQEKHSHENSYEYKEEKQTCPRNFKTWQTGAHVTSVANGFKSNGGCEVNQVKAAIVQYGAVAATAACRIPQFQGFEYGYVHNCATGYKVDHAVVVVGWDRARDGTEYWIVKNSWSAGWGKDGFINIKIGAADCLFMDQCTYITCEANNKATAPVPASKTSTEAKTCDLNSWKRTKNLSGVHKLDLGNGLVHMKCAHGFCTTCFTGSEKSCPDNYNTCKDFCWWAKDTLSEDVSSVADCPPQQIPAQKCNVHQFYKWDVSWWRLDGVHEFWWGYKYLTMKCTRGWCDTCYNKTCPSNYNTCKDFCYWESNLSDNVHNVKDCM